MDIDCNDIEITITLENSHNDNKFIIKKNYNNEVVSIEGIGSSFDKIPFRLSKGKANHIYYSIKSDSIVVYDRNHIYSNFYTYVFDRHFRILEEYHNDKLTRDYSYSKNTVI